MAILTHPGVWLTPLLLLIFHHLPVLVLLARLAQQCSNAICQRSMPNALCPQKHTHKHTHALPGKDTFQCRIYQYPRFRHQFTRDPRTEKHTLTQPWWVTRFICLPTGGAGAETGVGDETGPITVREQIIRAVTLIIYKHMGVWSTVTKNKGKKGQSQPPVTGNSQCWECYLLFSAVCWNKIYCQIVSDVCTAIPGSNGKKKYF